MSRIDISRASARAWFRAGVLCIILLFKSFRQRQSRGFKNLQVAAPYSR